MNSAMLRRMPRSHRVLIVEDDDDLRRMLRGALTFAGYDVEEAGNGLHALLAIDNHRPDAVILDLGLPIISGQTVRAEIAANAHTRNIPVIVITATAGAHDGLDAVCVLRKPFNIDRLLSVVRGCIASGDAASTC